MCQDGGGLRRGHLAQLQLNQLVSNKILSSLLHAPTFKHECLNTGISAVHLCQFFYFLPFFHRHAYENCVVLEARICYNVARLMALNSDR